MFQSGVRAGARTGPLLDRAAREIDAGRLPSCQLALARGGELLLDVTLGAATSADRYCLFSVTKAFVAAAVWRQLAPAGPLSPDTPVVEHVPEFATQGKDAVTVAHLLTHTAGFPRAPMRPEEGADPQRRRDRFRTWRLDWPPGSQTEYHPTSAHWVLADLLERLTGRPLGETVRTDLFDPLGLHRLALGVPPDRQHDIRSVQMVGTEPVDDGRAPTSAEFAPTFLLRYNEPAVRAAGVPGSGAVGTAAEVALFYQELLTNRAGRWHPQVLADATGRVRNHHPDPWTNVPANRTLGLVLAGDDGRAVLRDFGRGVGPRAFGAGGVGGQVAWADPDTGLSFCYLTDGLDCDVVRAFTRSAELSTLAARVAA